MAMLNNQMVSLGWFFPCFGDEVAFGGTDFAEPLPTSESPDTPEPELLEGAWERVEIPIGIHGAAIYGVPWIPLIYPSHVSIYTSTMDPSWDMDRRGSSLFICFSKNWVTDWLEEFICFCCSMSLSVCISCVWDELRFTMDSCFTGQLGDSEGIFRECSLKQTISERC